MSSIPAWKRAALLLPPLARIAAREQNYQARIEELEGRLAARDESVAPSFAVAHWVDHLWCDIYGVFVRGWAHAHGRAVRLVAVRSGDFRVTAGDFAARPDVAAHYP